jgi:hypothetical protein
MNAEVEFFNQFMGCFSYNCSMNAVAKALIRSSISRQYPGNFLEGLWKMKKNLHDDS